MKRNILQTISLFCLCTMIFACGSAQKQLQTIKQNNLKAEINLSKKDNYLPELEETNRKEEDTIKIVDERSGKEFLVMKAVKDDNGEMVASEELEAAVVTARFRNIAERNGEVDLVFDITVPKSLQHDDWQLRFFPKMYIQEDTVAFEPVIVTGRLCQARKLRGYERYNALIASIAKDSLRVVNMAALETFIQRNIPHLARFRRDSSFVSDEVFATYYGVSEQQAIDHYTSHFRQWVIKYKNNQAETQLSKIKGPDYKVRIDTIMTNSNEDIIYQYVQTIKTRPKLKKVDVVVGGEILKDNEKLYAIDESANLTFYISSLSFFKQNKQVYLKKVIFRKASANMTANIQFEAGKYNVNEQLADNTKELSFVKNNILDLLQNKTFELDSICITASASPEGKKEFNESISAKRSAAIREYLNKFMNHAIDSIYRAEKKEDEIMMDLDGNVKLIKDTTKRRSPIKLQSKIFGENWDLLNILVDTDTTLTQSQKERYFEIWNANTHNLDLCESKLMQEPFYKDIKSRLYPRLRAVRFDFYLHRKNMVKDTVVTQELDTVYMAGLQAIEDRDYKTAANLLGPYEDFNTAVAFVSDNRILSALLILDQLEETPEVLYLKAIIYSRQGKEKEAVSCYVTAAKKNSQYIHRGNLDPEIAYLIKKYNLNAVTQEEDEFDFPF